MASKLSPFLTAEPSVFGQKRQFPASISGVVVTNASQHLQ